MLQLFDDCFDAVVVIAPDCLLILIIDLIFDAHTLLVLDADVVDWK